MARFEQPVCRLSSLEFQLLSIMDTEPTAGGPNLSVDVHHRTTQLNLWMIVAIILFFVLGGLYVAHVFHHPPTSTHEMKESLNSVNERWTSSLC